MAPHEEAVRQPVNPLSGLVKGALLTLFYYLLLLAVLVYWQGSGLFLYEGF